MARGFEEEGVIGPFTLLTPHRMAVLRGRLEAFERDFPDQRGKLFQAPHLLFPWLFDLLRAPALLDRLEPILGPDILLLQCGFRIKEPGDRRYVAWHQDDYYIKIEPFFVTCVIAFAANDEASGCLKVVPGSHRGPLLAHRDRDDDLNILTRGQEITESFDEAKARAMVMAPGQAVAFHARTIHASEANRSQGRRINIQVEYCSTAARRQGSRDFAALVRGTDRYRHFDPLPAPAERLDAAAFAQHRAVVERRIRESYRGAKRRSPALD